MPTKFPEAWSIHWGALKMRVVAMVSRQAIFKIIGRYLSEQQVERVGTAAMRPLQTRLSKPVGNAQYALAFPFLVNHDATVDRLVEIGSSKNANKR